MLKTKNFKKDQILYIEYNAEIFSEGLGILNDILDNKENGDKIDQ